MTDHPRLRLHVVALPHARTVRADSWCAFSDNVRVFCSMMHTLGHAVFLYAHEENEADVTELVVCSEGSPATGPYDLPEFSPHDPLFSNFNSTVIREMSLRLQTRDFICLIGGEAQRPIAEAFPANMAIEYAVGYGGTFAPYRVFPSYAWMHTVYGAQASDAHAADGRYFDTVIPHPFEPEDFPQGTGNSGYYCYVGRLIDRKGWRLAQEVCEHLGKALIIAGPGRFTGYGKYVGVIGPEKRAELMGGAIATFVPTQYIEPFGKVGVESMLCGTPVISTDWGAFPEIVREPTMGFRCRTFMDFCRAAEEVTVYCDRRWIAHQARAAYSTENIGPQYERYFKRLMTLWDGGFYQGR